MRERGWWDLVVGALEIKMVSDLAPQSLHSISHIGGRTRSNDSRVNHDGTF